LLLLLSAALVAGVLAWATVRIASELRACRQEVARARTLQVMSAFAGASSPAEDDPRALLRLEPLARAARKIYPDEFAQLDRALGSTFPFSRDRIETAHAQWTADWLAWERSHDAEYKLKAAAVEEELARSAGSAALRARLDAVEREKLELYQRRYQEYVRVAKALQGLIG
jgi:hypothetical protein